MCFIGFFELFLSAKMICSYPDCKRSISDFHRYSIAFVVKQVFSPILLVLGLTGKSMQLQAV